MVKGMTLKEIAGSIVDVNISLKGDANFAVFPLESPDRIVIDIMPSDIMPVDIMPVEAAEAAPLSVENTSGTETKDSSSADSDNSDAGADPNPGAVEKGLISSVLPFQAKDYMLAQLILNVVLVIALIVMGIKLWSIAKASGKSYKVLKKNQDFADIIGGLQQQARGKNSTIGILHSAAAQLGTPDRGPKRTKKKRRGARTASLQEQYRKVYELAQLGLDRLAISQQSNVPIGEVNLILDLSKTRQQVGEIRG
jgi:Sec-independent protein translocase protein TatA